ncbi:MAG: phosphoribosyltransferase [Nitrospira sp.]|jgi:putative phosphoribosyl transferase|uniref:phosphoribosyltransferase n=1 Tax=Nitrospira sp. ND1 TaxID=1658518 RepID=UPI0009D5AD33|nr:phosphoribosyltransferase [Nitrospira sp. ND1]MBK7417889.1 phosphoribosyltransferase [Nitrospira sp.]MBK7485113.1 phosphoribosyltransferase [Nitrospira sp.]MBK8377108.1 phosphoribosyltransferase [Nitrospira sp.]MBK9995818.1 phosphoribosyltransferase [Nitrospira sp.]MBP6198953.1 phosphoribosyltransferase [Nitrospira sp.]
MFKNREEAGELLAQELIQFRKDPSAILLALPRGGVAVAYQLSLALHLALDVLITRKIGAPGNPEYALGAVSETGAVYWNREALLGLSLTERQLSAAVQAQQKEVTRRVALYRQGRPFPDLNDRTVILVDDGLATGATFFASVATARQGNPRRVIGAIPVGPRSTVEEARKLVDQLIVLRIPDPFYAVGNFYRDFEQVEDREVLQYLNLAEEASINRS